MCSFRHISSNPQYADSAAYAGKFRQLQARAMAAVRSKVQQVLRHAMEQVSLLVLVDPLTSVMLPG